MCAKVHSQEGNSPECILKSVKILKWEKYKPIKINRKVSLEAAIPLKRA